MPTEKIIYPVYECDTCKEEWSEEAHITTCFTCGNDTCPGCGVMLKTILILLYGDSKTTEIYKILKDRLIMDAYIDLFIHRMCRNCMEKFAQLKRDDMESGGDGVSPVVEKIILLKKGK